MITDDTLEALRSNDERLDNLFLYLDDYSLFEDDDGQEPITRALVGNTRVTAVDCDMHLDTMTETLGGLMTAIGKLSSLQRLRCSSSGDYAVTMAALATALTAQRHLKSLDLANFLLHNEPSYQDLCEALQHHPTLDTVSLGFGYSSGASNNSSLTPLLHALQTLPRLELVRLDGARFASRQALPPEGLAVLLKGTMSTLEVHDFDLSPSHLEAVAKALATNTHLKVLSMSCHKFYPDKSAATAAWSQALRANSTLETLQLPHELLLDHKKAVDLTALAEFLHSLRGNASLCRLQLVGSTASASASLPQTAACAFRHMLQHNYGLVSIQLMPWFDTDEWQAEISLYTKLNAMGRGRLVAAQDSDSDSNCSSNKDNQWMDALGQVQDDLSCLFHLLLLNPLLCSGGDKR
ncbi:expressed unknown protein [Seminavis robusta]|uniref:Uncharacterized protein n=1 Tax=Seminavis robusta TaxID=568900 RepID=A0A9N8EHI9_9STRA|nr:expressed unknown protein [Seminavis robusta]|eukprot:Sro945_g223180.1 n/a (408) ;mRNA; r:37440-38663